MSFQPGPALGLALLGVLYVRAVRVLARRGFRVPVPQQIYWWVGFLFLTGAFFSPLDTWAEKLVSAHMAQHVLMADIAVPLLMIGVRNPVLQFYLPRPVLEPLARRRTCRPITFSRRAAGVISRSCVMGIGDSNHRRDAAIAENSRSLAPLGMTN